ncbi:hypothetical protein [Flavonifractor sp. An306]|uniref:hypothetical protein n=1 Tax=Flavonifractor sp. An306 TaxID=1965629 RepID=UPI00174D4DC2|nr:hypothetical protein [Flavonifractor sp. An306]
MGELRSEKNLLLASLAYTEEDAALNEYAGLRQQAQKEYQTFQKKKSGQERQFLSHSH